MPKAVAAPRSVADLKRAFAQQSMTKSEVVAAAKKKRITLPADFFASDKPVAPSVEAPAAFRAQDGAARTGAVQIAQLRQQAAGAPRAPMGPRTLPENAPDKIRVGKRMVLTKIAQTKDVITYVHYIKGKPTLVFVMGKYDPAQAAQLVANTKGFGAGRRGFVLADRDGVLKDSRFLNEVDKAATKDVMISSALDAAKELHEANVGLGVVTNQGGYQSGKMSFEDTIAINVRVNQQVADRGGHVDAIFICPFTSALEGAAGDDVDARKPSSGMALLAIDLLKKSGVKVLAMIGDQRSDGGCGQGAGLPFHAVTDANGRWEDEKVEAARKGQALTVLDTSPGRYQEGPDFATAARRVIAALP